MINEKIGSILYSLVELQIILKLNLNWMKFFKNILFLPKNHWFLKIKSSKFSPFDKGIIQPDWFTNEILLKLEFKPSEILLKIWLFCPKNWVKFFKKCKTSSRKQSTVSNMIIQILYIIWLLVSNQCKITSMQYTEINKWN